MVFLFLILILILLIVFSKIVVEVQRYKFISSTKRHINKDYVIILKLSLFGKIPLIRLKLTDEKIRKLKIRQKFKEKFKNINIKKLENDISITKIFGALNKFRITIKKLNLKIEIGTENASLTAILVPILSTFVSFVIRKTVKKYENQTFSIKPLFINKNLLNIEFSGIFEIKMIHIINIIYILNKKKKGEDKNERTSNRRSYAYSYE